MLCLCLWSIWRWYELVVRHTRHFFSLSFKWNWNRHDEFDLPSWPFSWFALAFEDAETDGSCSQWIRMPFVGYQDNLERPHEFALWPVPQSKPRFPVPLPVVSYRITTKRRLFDPKTASSFSSSSANSCLISFCKSACFFHLADSVGRQWPAMGFRQSTPISFLSSSLSFTLSSS